ncbi:MAG: hypothetical protein HY014_10180 [Acidobacteria bacterium]|nr:hypothetical protein [Acidobacteriota bacterium]MBI3488523.1 hypothetical protein [Acidobacteriota bacterium]
MNRRYYSLIILLSIFKFPYGWGQSLQHPQMPAFRRATVDAFAGLSEISYSSDSKQLSVSRKDKILLFEPTTSNGLRLTTSINVPHPEPGLNLAFPVYRNGSIWAISEKDGIYTVDKDRWMQHSLPLDAVHPFGGAVRWVKGDNNLEILLGRPANLVEIYDTKLKTRTKEIAYPNGETVSEWTRLTIARNGTTILIYSSNNGKMLLLDETDASITEIQTPWVSRILSENEKYHPGNTIPFPQADEIFIMPSLGTRFFVSFALHQALPEHLLRNEEPSDPTASNIHKSTKHYYIMHIGIKGASVEEIHQIRTHDIVLWPDENGKLHSNRNIISSAH